MKEYEREIETPTGARVVEPEGMRLNGTLVSADCALVGRWEADYGVL